MSPRYERVNAQDDDDDDHSSSNNNNNNRTTTTSGNRSNGATSLGVPNSPPPSFHSRASSGSPPGGRGRRHGPVDPALADAFDTDNDNDNNDDDDDESDDDNADDRQRLMRSRDALRPVRAPSWMTTPAASGNASDNPLSQQTPSTSTATATATATATTQPTRRPAPPATPTTGRVYGGGIQSDGVFSNITARPEPGEEKDELPPVSIFPVVYFIFL